MASVQVDGSGERLNTELNLVPFIDLLSTLVLFLLVTAVWLQISAIPVAVKSKGVSTVSSAPERNLRIRVTASGYSLTWPSGSSQGPSFMRAVDGKYDQEQLATVLRGASGKVAAATVSADDNVDYGAVIQAVDTAKTNGFQAVGLSTD